MPNTTDNFVVEELDQLYGITEEELASASIVCSTSTCSGASPAEVTSVAADGTAERTP